MLRWSYIIFPEGPSSPEFSPSRVTSSTSSLSCHRRKRARPKYSSSWSCCGCSWWPISPSLWRVRTSSSRSQVPVPRPSLRSPSMTAESSSFVSDSVDLLVEFGLLGHEQKQKYAVLILRNLGFHSANKPKLLANGGIFLPIPLLTIQSGNTYSFLLADKVLPFLLRCVEAGGSGVKSVACSALFALVYNSQKVSPFWSLEFLSYSLL